MTKRIMMAVIMITIIVTVVGVVWGATPGVPTTMMIQGKLTDNNLVPVPLTGNLTISTTLYLDAVAVGSETATLLSESGATPTYNSKTGIFNCPISPNDTMGNPLPFNYAYQVKIKVGPSGSLQDMGSIPLLSSPYAMTTKNVYGGYGYFAGTLEVGTTTPGSYLVYFTGGTFYSERGGVAAAGYSWSVGSDRRWKKNITPLENSLQKVCRLQGVNFELKTKEFPDKNFPTTPQIGFIAQDVEKVIPQLVSTDPEGYKSLDESKLTAVLVEAVKELKAKNEALKNKVAEIEQKLAK